jgi:hypothetical protein
MILHRKTAKRPLDFPYENGSGETVSLSFVDIWS